MNFEVKSFTVAYQDGIIEPNVKFADVWLALSGEHVQKKATRKPVVESAKPAKPGKPAKPATTPATTPAMASRKTPRLAEAQTAFMGARTAQLMADPEPQ